jgi:hypothetical protein
MFDSMSDRRLDMDPYVVSLRRHGEETVGRTAGR